ncbi:MAG: hypothetical protein MHM6MM_001478 [Cercozoa sp. M6MM]
MPGETNVRYSPAELLASMISVSESVAEQRRTQLQQRLVQVRQQRICDKPHIRMPSPVSTQSTHSWHAGVAVPVEAIQRITYDSRRAQQHLLQSFQPNELKSTEPVQQERQSTVRLVGTARRTRQRKRSRRRIQQPPTDEQFLAELNQEMHGTALPAAQDEGSPVTTEDLQLRVPVKTLTEDTITAAIGQVVCREHHVRTGESLEALPFILSDIVAHVFHVLPARLPSQLPTEQMQRITEILAKLEKEGKIKAVRSGSNIGTKFVVVLSTPFAAAVPVDGSEDTRRRKRQYKRSHVLGNMVFTQIKQTPGKSKRTKRLLQVPPRGFPNMQQLLMTLCRRGRRPWRISDISNALSCSPDPNFVEVSDKDLDSQMIYDRVRVQQRARKVLRDAEAAGLVQCIGRMCFSSKVDSKQAGGSEEDDAEDDDNERRRVLASRRSTRTPQSLRESVADADRFLQQWQVRMGLCDHRSCPFLYRATDAAVAQVKALEKAQQKNKQSQAQVSQAQVSQAQVSQEQPGTTNTHSIGTDICKNANEVDDTLKSDALCATVASSAASASNPHSQAPSQAGTGPSGPTNEHSAG